MVTEIAPVTFHYSHTIGRQENRSGSGFFYPIAITRDEDNLLYVLSRGSETPAFFPCKRVTVFTIDEELVREFGTKVPPEDADASAPDGSFMWPTSVALDNAGMAYVADEWLNRISIFDKNGECVGKWGTLGDGDGEINRPSGLAFDAEDNLYLVDSVNHRVQIFTKEGKFISKWGRQGSGDGELDMPWGIDTDSEGNVYVADWRNDRIQKFTGDGQFMMKFGTTGKGEGEFNRPTDVAVDKEGLIYVADWDNDRVQVFDGQARFITVILGDATLSKWGETKLDANPEMRLQREVAQGLERERFLRGRIGVVVDDQDRLFIVDSQRNRIQIYRKLPPYFLGRWDGGRL